MRGLIFCFLFLISGSLLAQNSVNQLDVQGRKQGYWTKKDSDGKLVYQATFKDDKPVGEMKRFHPNGRLKAILNFTEGNDTSDGQLFDESGKLVANGKYEGQKKTGEWKYMDNSKVVSTENYSNGLKNGTSKRFYKTGELLEESNWQNDKLHGIYRSFFQDGKPFLECLYSGGKKNGSFITWFSNGFMELDAQFTNDLRDKDWKYFDETAKLRYILKFELGKLVNQEVQDSIDRANSAIFRPKGDSIPDPEKFIQNPEEYLQIIQKR